MGHLWYRLSERITLLRLLVVSQAEYTKRLGFIPDTLQVFV